MKKLLICLLSVAMGVSISSGLTLLNIRDAVRLAINDNDSNNQRWTDAQLNTIINQGHRDANIKMLLLEATTSFTLTSGTTYYNLPTDTMHIKRLTHKNKVLEETTVYQLDRDDAQWESRTAGDPTKYFIFRSTQIAFHPAPAATSTGTVKIYYTYEPSDLSSDTDEPFGGLMTADIYDDLLIYWTTWRVLESERRLSEAANYAALYYNTIGQMRGVYYLDPNYKPSFTGRERVQ